MTATSYVDLDNDDLGANKILRAATMSALDTNPVSIAQRGTGAPWLNGVGAITSITSGSGNWSVLGGVYRIKVTAIGGGGGNTSAGAATTFSTITANGGGSASGLTPGAGGTASGGDVNISGSSGTLTALMGDLYGGSGGVSAMGALGKGAGATSTAADGGGAGTAIKVFSIEPGDLLAYSVGASGGGSATDGIIIIEY